MEYSEDLSWKDEKGEFRHINNVRIFGDEESVIASGYPRRTDLPVDMFGAIDPTDWKHSRNRAGKLATVPNGSGHDVFLTGIVVQFDVTAPVKIWTEMQRYHFLEFVSSASSLWILKKKDVNDYKEKLFDPLVDDQIIERLHTLQKDYIEEEDPTKKQGKFLRMIYSCPVGLKLTARMSTNYRQLKTIYSQRRHHQLSWWREFCEDLEKFPASSFITGEKPNHEQ